MSDFDFDIVDHWWRNQWMRDCARCCRAGLQRPSGRDERPCERHIVRIDQADPRWATVSRALRVPARAGISDGTRGALEDGSSYHMAAALRVAAPQRTAARVAPPPGAPSLRSHRRPKTPARNPVPELSTTTPPGSRCERAITAPSSTPMPGFRMRGWWCSTPEMPRIGEPKS